VGLASVADAKSAEARQIPPGLINLNPLMAGDPELPRFAGSSCYWQKAGQSRIDLQGKAADSSAPWQHLQLEVLHFVCELRGTHSRSREK
jgi:hypothetical protein